MAGYNSSVTSYSSNNYNNPLKDSYANKSEGTQDKDSNEGKLFVGGLAWISTEESLRTYFEKFGPVANINLKRNKEDASKHRGFAFIKFVNAEDADAVVNQEEPHIIDGSKVDPKSACPQGIKPEQRTRKIFVGGLQSETTEEKIHEYFSTFGQIKNNIEFAIDHSTKKRRGFCFIEFANEAIVDRIVKDRFHEIAGKRLETKRALSKQQQENQAAASFSLDGLRRPRIPGSVVVGGYGGVPVATAASPFQPVIYIHPDTLSTGYPVSALGLGGLSSYSGVTPSYASSLETLYTPYSQDTRHVTPARASHASAQYPKSRHDPYRR